MEHPNNPPAIGATPTSILPYDGRLLFAMRALRMFAYGLLSIVLVLYLVEVGLRSWEIGLLLTLTMVGDTVISLWLTTHADQVGRRRTLIVGSLLLFFTGIALLATDNFIVLMFAAALGVISPGGKEIGPFLSVEQAALAHIIPVERYTHIFAWYNLAGSIATAAGAFVGGWLTSIAQQHGAQGAEAYRPVLLAYVAIGAALIGGSCLLSSAIEVGRSEIQTKRTLLGLHASRGIVLKLSLLFGLDAFGGGFIIQSVVAYWFHRQFQMEPSTLGAVFFFANLLAGVSALAAGWLARRIGLINTMVYTHLPSNALLLLLPAMPTAAAAVAVLLLRSCISQMDVPTRQAYTMTVVRAEERSAAAGVTTVARSVGAAVSPMLATILVSSVALTSLPFFLAGGLKIVYDVLLYRGFASHPAKTTPAT